MQTNLLSSLSKYIFPQIFLPLMVFRKSRRCLADNLWKSNLNFFSRLLLPISSSLYLISKPKMWKLCQILLTSEFKYLSWLLIVTLVLRLYLVLHKPALKLPAKKVRDKKMNIVILSCWTIKNVDDIMYRLVFADKWEFPMWKWKQGEDNNHTTFFQGTKLEWFRAKSWWLIVWINSII